MQRNLNKTYIKTERRARNFRAFFLQNSKSLKTSPEWHLRSTSGASNLKNDKYIKKHSEASRVLKKRYYLDVALFY
jgi:hypothetical protein